MSDVPVTIDFPSLLSRYPEFTWLTGSTDATPERSVAAQGATIGQALFPHLSAEELVEFDRTAVGILALAWILTDDYAAFTACQPATVKLTPESFAELRTLVLNVVSDDESFRAMLVSTLTNDLGKVRAVVDRLADELSVEDVDHDRLLLTALERIPAEFPSFSALSPLYRERILSGLRADFNLAQFVQLEVPAASIAGAVALAKSDPVALRFHVVHAVLDVAGAAGHAVQNGSMVMTEPTWQAYRAAIEHIEHPLGVVPTYLQYVMHRGATVGLGGSEPLGYTATRLACMLRLQKPEEGILLVEAIQALPPALLGILLDEFSRTGMLDGCATMLYYAPAILANTKAKLAKVMDAPTALTRTLELCLPLFGRLFAAVRGTARSNREGVYTVQCKPVADRIAAKGADPEQVIPRIAFRPEPHGESGANLVFEDVPTLATVGFPQKDLGEVIPGSRVLVVGIGGGSDGIQAAIIAKLLEARGRTVMVASVRTAVTNSPGPTGSIGERRTVENHAGSPFDGVYLLTAQSTGSGRFLEPIPAGELPVYYVIYDDPEHLARQLGELVRLLNVDSVVAVDTGGDALYSSHPGPGVETTPDQDLESLRALATVGVPVITCEVAVGVDSPPDAEQVMRNGLATYVEPSADEVREILDTYRRWRMDGSDDGLYGKTPLAWQAALRATEPGFVCLPLPPRVVVQRGWNPFTFVTAAMRGMFIMELSKHLAAIDR